MTDEITQAEKKQTLKDSYLSRAQADADLTAQGRFKKETATRVTGVPTYPSMPPSSPWSSGFDQNVEPPLGFAVDEMPAVGTENEIQASLEPTLKPPDRITGPLTVEDRVGEPVTDGANLPASSVAGFSRSSRRPL
jgi:hypothetical protein